MGGVPGAEPIGHGAIGASIESAPSSGARKWSLKRSWKHRMLPTGGQGSGADPNAKRCEAAGQSAESGAHCMGEGATMFFD